MHTLITKLQADGVYIHVPREDHSYAMEVGVRMLVLRHLVIADGDLLSINPAEEPLLQYYANAIAHLFEASKEPAEQISQPASPTTANIA